MRRLGASAEEIEAALGKSNDADDFPVWPENWATLGLFRECATQWAVVAGFEHLLYIGLPWERIDVLLRRERVKRARQVFSDLRLMERGALEFLNKP